MFTCYFNLFFGEEPSSLLQLPLETCVIRISIVWVIIASSYKEPSLNFIITLKKKETQIRYKMNIF